ncbi:ABC transporter ATP-binding protein [Sanyastnella coralliicola]|uniref:ABC transporter ATP-binding protein n=1 Tax=Sanyastnella coralliicola TaxID=3069118 RepID=UPI0027B89E06|nr:ATP-binding cassette domain-containing protein [Longitalea sp. SCSIO 12813]
MQVQLHDLGRRFGREWIFRHIEQEIPSGSHVLIIGHNGSGKSTLLQAISGFLSPTEGHVFYSAEGEKIEEIAHHTSMATPYLDVFQDLTLEEAIDFHCRFRNLRNGMSQEELVEVCRFGKDRKKSVKNFSSGMRQRLRLGLAIYTDSSLLFLDEPSSNLDKENIEWYRQQLASQAEGRTIFISSNSQKEEYLQADITLDVVQFRPA